MSSHAIYSMNIADPPEWKPGEEIAAGAFVGITLFLFVEVNVLIHRAFRKRQGLYFWSMQIGSLGILIETLGLILKFFGASKTDPIWPLYTLFIEVGWGMYATAQSLVLYSRLHLVNRNRKIHRCVLWMILSTILTFILPTMVVGWPAHNPYDHEMSSLWSPRVSIMNRYTQIGHTVTESIISGLYIWSLFRLMKLKSNVRSRRVFMDLVYVNVVVIALDLISVVLVYANQAGNAFSIQACSYILKLRLEFVVLNQLMDLAARGMRRETFKRNRYYLPANQKGRPFHGNVSSQETKTSHLGPAIDLPKDSQPTTLSSSGRSTDFISSPQPAYELTATSRSASDAQTVEPATEPRSNSIDHSCTADKKSFSSDRNPLTQPAKSVASGHSKRSKPLGLGRVHRSHRKNSGRNEKDDEEDDEEEVIGLHRWERSGVDVIEVPWFRSKVDV